MVVVQISADGGESLSEGDSPDVVIFRGSCFGESRVGLIEGDEDGSIVHEGGIVDFIMQKAG